MTPIFHRDYTAERLNKIANHPAVFPFIAMKGQEAGLDLSPLINNLNNIALLCPDGGIMALTVEQGIYEIHTQFTGELRGAAMIKLVRDMISELFLNSPAVELVTQIPVSNPAALGLVRAISGRFEFSRENAWIGLDGIPTAVDYYALRWNDWVWSDWAMKGLEAKGIAFHEELERQQLSLGFTEPPHLDDPAHNVMVGATLELFRNGWLDKALIMYNRWARFAGYAEIGLLSYHPTVVDIRTAVLELKGSEFRVVRVPAALTSFVQPRVEAALAVAEPVASALATPEPELAHGTVEELVARAKIIAGQRPRAGAKAEPLLDPFAPFTPDAGLEAVARELERTAPTLNEKVA